MNSGSQPMVRFRTGFNCNIFVELKLGLIWPLIIIMIVTTFIQSNKQYTVYSSMPFIIFSLNSRIEIIEKDCVHLYANRYFWETMDYNWVLVSQRFWFKNALSCSKFLFYKTLLLIIIIKTRLNTLINFLICLRNFECSS